MGPLAPLVGGPGGAGGRRVEALEALEVEPRELDRGDLTAAQEAGEARDRGEGEIVVLMGLSGSGKSTLLKAIAMRSGVNIWQGERRMRYAANPYEEQLFRALDLKWQKGQVQGSYFDSQVFRNFAQK